MSTYDKIRGRLPMNVAQMTGSVETPDLTSVEVLEKDGADMVLLARGTNAPGDGESGYAKGCIFIDTDVAGGTSGMYENIGTPASCEFNALGGTVPTVEADGIAIIHDASAANYEPLIVELRESSFYEAALKFGGDGQPLRLETSLGEIFSVFPEQYYLADHTVAVHNADPVANLNASQLFIKPTSNYHGVLVSPNDGGGHANFDTVTNSNVVTVFYSANASDGASKVYIDEATGGLYANLGAGIGQILVDDNNNGYFVVTHTNDPDGAGYLLLYIDDNAGTSSQRLVFNNTVDAGNVNVSNYVPSSENETKDFAVFDAIYFDKDASAGEQLQTDNEVATLVDVKIRSSRFSNSFVRVVYNADAATDGTQVYVNPDAADATDYLVTVDSGSADRVLSTDPTTRPDQVIQVAA